MILNVGVYVFLLISGMLYAKKTIVDGVGFIKKRWIRLCIPMYYLAAFLLIFNILNGRPQVLWSIPTYLLDLQGMEFIVSGWKPYQMNGLGQLWFLTAIMICYFLLIPVKKLEKRGTGDRKVHAPFIFAMLFLADIFLAYTLRVQLNYFITFFLGYALGDCAQRLGRKQYGLMTAAMICAMAVRLLCRSWVDGTVLYNDLVVPFTHMVLALWIFGTIQFAARCAPGVIKMCAESRGMVWLDKNSLYLYMTHYMFLVGPLYISSLPIPVPMQLLVFLAGAFVSEIILRWISEETIRRIRV